MIVEEQQRQHLPGAHSSQQKASEVQAREVSRELSGKIKGEVRFDEGSRALYATDLSMYRQVPIGVVLPRDVEDVFETVAICRRYDVPLLGRGCGTSLAGQCCNVAVVVDFSKYMNRVLEVDPKTQRARVEPGVIYDQLRDATEKHHLVFAPDPATHAYCTLGGMIGNDSCGVHSIMGGRTVDNVHELEILTYDGLHTRVGPTGEAELERIIREGGRKGEIFARLKALRDKYADKIRERFPNIPRRVSGYNLPELLPESGFQVARSLVGSESTCVLVLSAAVDLLHSPSQRALLVIGYPDIFQAADQVMPIRDMGPVGLEAVHTHVIQNMERKGHPLKGARLMPEGDTWLLVEFGGETHKEAEEQAHEAQEKLKQSGVRPDSMKLLTDKEEQLLVWEVREAGVGASRIPHVEDAWPSWEDSAVAPAKLGAYLRDFYKLLEKYHYRWTIFGHFGDGCVHCRITFDTRTPEGVNTYRAFMIEAAHLVSSYGGSLSGEHGDGQARGELLPIMFGSEIIEAFREFKSIWDPRGKMNPGKKIDAYPLDHNLRTGPDYHPQPVRTYFQYPDDKGSFALATERCFGVGKCRSLHGGTMCPSFRATREEQHTTRGRAHLLFEMMRGEAIKDGWRDPHVKEALDLCLACKGCKGDCPVSVDMATYKAEFLAHFYEGRLRPRSAYAMGLIDRWARLASRAPQLANFLTQTPLLSSMAKALAGIAPQRSLPAFASETFQHWFQRRPVQNASKPGVLLWPDTFNNYFFPQTARAAVEALEAAGIQVMVPRHALCCGRPLYDYGMLDRAQVYLQHILKTLQPAIAASTPIVVLEPSCLAVFRDEMPNLFPDDANARKLRDQCFLLSEFLLKQDGYRPPHLNRKALVHGHCHQKALLGMGSDEQLLAAMGLQADILDSGCCGMAGSFGFEPDHYDVSMRIGDLVLLPRVRAADPDTLLIASGFSCREQIAQATDRRALHVAEVLQMALHEGPTGPEGSAPERGYIQERPPSTLPVAVGAAALTGLALVGGYLWMQQRKDRRS